jgi:hypothetical protein
MWLHAHKYSCSTDALDNASARGHIEVVKWLAKHRKEGCTQVYTPYNIHKCDSPSRGKKGIFYTILRCVSALCRPCLQDVHYVNALHSRKCLAYSCSISELQCVSQRICKNALYSTVNVTYPTKLHQQLWHSTAASGLLVSCCAYQHLLYLFTTSACLTVD